MCGSDFGSNFESFSKRKLRNDALPDLNPKRHIKKTLATDFDFTGQLDAEEAMKAAEEKQKKGIETVNKDTLSSARPGVFIAETGGFTGTPASRKRRGTLLTDLNKTLLG